MKPTINFIFVVAAVVGGGVIAPRLAPGTPTGGGSVVGRVLVVDGGRPTSREVWVYLEHIGPRRGAPASVAPPVREIRQKDQQFSPHVLVVPVGTTVAFPNYDREEHNVFSPTDAGEFDLGRYNTDHKGKLHKFEDAAEMEIYCDIHKQMWARVKVVDTDAALIAPVDADGHFAITGVPAGTYRLHAWTWDSEEAIADQKIELAEGASVSLAELHIELGVDRIQTHLRYNKSPYGPY